MARLAPGIVVGADGVPRCWWGASTADYAEYHDREWGVPEADDFRLFEKICLEGFQSGLSWLTILRKRAAFRRAFRDFDFEKVARFNRSSVERLLADASIVRHRGKIEATIENARQACAVADEHGSLAAFLWRFEPAPTARPKRLDQRALIAMTTSPEAIALSRELKRRGWRFVGPTTAYSFMQAMGLVNDHLEGCAARPRIERARAAFRRPGRQRQRPAAAHGGGGSRQP